MVEIVVVVVVDALVGVPLECVDCCLFTMKTLLLGLDTSKLPPVISEISVVAAWLFSVVDDVPLEDFVVASFAGLDFFAVKPKIMLINYQTNVSKPGMNKHFLSKHL